MLHSRQLPVKTIALCTTQGADTIGDMSADATDTPESRRKSIPIHGWWRDAVRREIELRKRAGTLTQKKLAAKIGTSEPQLTRAINLTQPVLEIVIAISDELELPYPVLLPETEEEALYLATQRRMFKSDRQVHDIATGVAETTQESQTPVVPSSHDGSRRKRRRSQHGKNPRL